jgi:hypothetical protein
MGNAALLPTLELAVPQRVRTETRRGCAFFRNPHRSKGLWPFGGGGEDMAKQLHPLHANHGWGCDRESRDAIVRKAFAGKQARKKVEFQPD